MTIPGQENYDREYQWSTGQPFAGEFFEIRLLMRPMDLWVRREPEITPTLSYATKSDLVLPFFRLRVLAKMSRQKVHLGNKRGKGHNHFGKCRPRILWEHLSDNFTQSYSRCDAARRYGVQSCPKGMNDRPWVSSTVRVQFYGGRKA